MPSDEEFVEPLEPAASFLNAHIEERRGNVFQKGARWVVAAVSAAAFGDVWGVGSTVDLVVTRRATGVEVIRTPAGHVEEADLLLRQVRADLATKTVEEFVSEWHLPSPPPPSEG
ncbi:hypothetical protein GCM10027416_16140 [Okibacterium endophyticum]